MGFWTGVAIIGCLAAMLLIAGHTFLSDPTTFVIAAVVWYACKWQQENDEMQERIKKLEKTKCSS